MLVFLNFCLLVMLLVVELVSLMMSPNGCGCLHSIDTQADGKVLVFVVIYTVGMFVVVVLYDQSS